MTDDCLYPCCPETLGNNNNNTNNNNNQQQPPPDQPRPRHATSLAPLQKRSMPLRRTTEEKKGEQGSGEGSPIEIRDDEEEEGGERRKEEPMETDELPDLDKPAEEEEEGGKEKKESSKKGDDDNDNRGIIFVWSCSS